MCSAQRERFVEAVHAAFARVADRPGEHECWRSAVSEARSAEDLRLRLAALWERSEGSHGDWPTVVRVALADWEEARDLALLALASRPGHEEA